jgi:hypothetical protein
MDSIIPGASRERSRKTTPASSSCRQVTPASSSATAPKPKGGFGSSTGRDFSAGLQSDAQREAKAEERLEALLADPAEEGAQVVMGPTRCAALWPLPALACMRATTLPAIPHHRSPLRWRRAVKMYAHPHNSSPGAPYPLTPDHPPHPTARQDRTWSYPQAAGRAAQVGAAWAPEQTPEHRFSGDHSCKTTQPARGRRIHCPREARALQPDR